MSEQTSTSPLKTYLTRTLRVTTNDTRFFTGELKCTDRDKNLILSSTTEYRQPKETTVEEGEEEVKSRYIGLVVIPGEVITKIEVMEGRAWGKSGWQ